MSLAYILLLATTIVLALFLFIMLFLACAWCIHWCQTCTCCSCRGRKRSGDKQDQELLSQDALEPECEKCEEAMPLSSQPPTDVVRAKSASKGSLRSSKGSLIEPKTPDRDLEDGRKPPSRRSSGGKRTPIPSPYDKERRRRKYWALRNAWMAANILQQPVKNYGDQEAPTPDSMDGEIPA